MTLVHAISLAKKELIFLLFHKDYKIFIEIQIKTVEIIIIIYLSSA